MKRFKWLGLCCVLGLSAMARAEESAGPDAQTLGTVDAFIEKCAEVDPPNAERYHGLVQMAAQGASEDTVSKVRTTNEYQAAHDSAMKSFESAKASDTVRNCRRSLVSEK